ncbi:response regulator [Palleronia sp. LCG004]|uniref:response regulator n=1 Tax=Palleronia sp. LCG004 TaxID=3079304 RepID=UPI002943887F|nr:response regulator [Palleronia sp. LCG004]WOI57924.1 response regulator [Palleronia sp. LCG004]
MVQEEVAHPYGAFPRILHVEDDAFDRAALARLLRKAFGTVVLDAVGRLSEARTLLRSVRYDSVFVDHILPDGLGTQFVQDVVDQGLCPGSRMTLLTGLADIADHGRARDLRGCRVVSKNELTVELLRHPLRDDRPIRGEEP